MTVLQTPLPYNPTQVSTMQQYPTTTTGLASAPPVNYGNLTPAQQAISSQLAQRGAVDLSGRGGVTPTTGYGSAPDATGMGVPTTGNLTAPQMTLANLIGNQQPGTGYLARGIGGAPSPSPTISGNTINPAPNRSYPTLSNRAAPLVV